MGEAVQVPVEDLDVRAVRRRLDRSIAALAEMLRDGQLDVRADSCGFEVELDLVDPLGRPRLVNPAVLRSLARRDVQAELSRFNLELNLDPRPLRGDVLRRLDDELSGALTAVSGVAQEAGATAMAVGTLPTLHAEDLTVEHLSENPRYALLDSALARARRGVVHLDISGPEPLTLTTSSIAIQAAATSLQVHLQVAPDDFARYYNAAQAVSPALVAVSGNARFLLGHRLWHETRIPLIEQSLDIRTRRERAVAGPAPAAGVARRPLGGLTPGGPRRQRAPDATVAAAGRDGRPARRAARAGRCRRCTTCGCTTAPSGAGTARSTTCSTATPTCGSRAG